MRNINLIVVHCSATRSSMDIGADEIYDWHTKPRPDGRGWSDIGYHFVIRRNGQIQTGRPLDRAGAHVKGYNENSIGICLIGGLNEDGKPYSEDGNGDDFTPEQYEALLYKLAELRDTYPDTGICGHRDLSPDLNDDGVITKGEWIKNCPCFDVSDFISNNM